MSHLRLGFGALVVVAGMLVPASAASAQQDDEVIGDVEISFDVGDVDPATGEWPIEAVEVAGDLEDGREFTVELTGAGNEVVWSGTQPFTAPVTRIPVTEPVGVGEVTGAGVSQGITAVEGVQIQPPTVDFSASGSGGGGQLALSMVMAVLLVAIVFRTPLPSATTQRWTK
jgi:hypothetical protein